MLIIIPVIFLIIFSGCSARFEKPVYTADSTIFYPSRKTNGIEARITFCKKIGRKSGKRLGVGTIFTLEEKAYVHGFADLKNCFLNTDQPLMFHIDWIDPDGNSFFQKRIDLTPEDSTTTLYSAISIPPDKREPGEYMFRVYLFRELIAEKKFTLLPVGQAPPSQADLVKAVITLSSKTDSDTAQDSIFTISEKGSVYAVAEVDNLTELNDDDLKFYLEWIAPDGSSYYKKQFDLSPEDSAATLTSAISLDPDKRQPGTCYVKLLLGDDLVTEKKFVLRKLVKPPPPKIRGIEATIELCGSVDKKTGFCLHPDSVFIIREKDWIHAVVQVNTTSKYNKALKFSIDWIGPDGKSFYKKQIDLKPAGLSSMINSSISLAPDKRQAGTCLVRVYLFDKRIAEKKFVLRAD